MDKDLAELEKTMRYAAERDIRVLLRKDLATFIAEYDRRGQVEQAAAALVGWWNRQSDGDKGGSNADAADLLDALAAAVHGETP